MVIARSSEASDSDRLRGPRNIQNQRRRGVWDVLLYHRWRGVRVSARAYNWKSNGHCHRGPAEASDFDRFKVRAGRETATLTSVGASGTGGVWDVLS